LILFSTHQYQFLEKPMFFCKQCGSNAFKGYFDDAKESRVKQILKIQEWSFQESSFKNQDSRIIKIKIQDLDSRIKRRINQDKY